MKFILKPIGEMLRHLRSTVTNITQKRIEETYSLAIYFRLDFMMNGRISKLKFFHRRISCWITSCSSSLCGYRAIQHMMTICESQAIQQSIAKFIIRYPSPRSLAANISLYILQCSLARSKYTSKWSIFSAFMYSLNLSATLSIPHCCHAVKLWIFKWEFVIVINSSKLSPSLCTNWPHRKHLCLNIVCAIDYQKTKMVHCLHIKPLRKKACVHKLSASQTLLGQNILLLE